MAVLVKSIVTACDTNAQGEKVRAAILKALDENTAVQLDFSGISNVTSSFVNSAFIELLPHYDIATIKNRLSITRVNRQIGNMINRRFQSETRVEN